MMWLIGLALAEPAPEIVGALENELARATTELALPGEDGPHWVQLEVVDGTYATMFAEFGAMMTDDVMPHRLLRVEIRSGDESFDSANFEAFGEGDGVTSGRLPIEDVQVAIERELWLATDRAYKMSVEQLARKSAELEGQDDERPAMWPATPVVDLSAEARPLDADGLRDRVAALSAVLGEYPEFESGAAAGRDWQGLRVLVNSEGSKIAQPTGFAVIRVEAILRHEDGSRLRDGRWWVAESVADLPPLDEMLAETREMADWLVGLNEARVLNDYLGPVLFEAPASVELFRQLAAPEMLGTPPPASGRGIFGEIVDKRPTARIGRRLLPEGWSLVDDPNLDAVGGYAYDQDGVRGKRVEVVSDGVVRSVLHSRVPAHPDGESTGHGRSLGTERREAHPSIVTVTPDRSRSDKALRKKGLRMAAQAGSEGLLVVKLVEPPAMSEDFDVFFTGDGPPPGLTMPYEVVLLHPDGTEEPIRGLRFSGVDRRALRDIVMAGPTSGPTAVLDGKPGPARYHIGAVGGMPGSWEAPAVLVSELELVGNHGGDARVIPSPVASED
ncbi:MAG: hypothetical protein GY913_10795 [Proteobacteria bacterium]|nr:hypothetical protein [Pseudomonadota bacterium]MCP4917400.1 hypothetical protein [Pseudomonadota bacterium]